MLINHKEKSLEDYQEFCKEYLSHEKYLEERQVKILPLIWALIQIFFRHGNQRVYFHICGYEKTWDCPMEAEGLSVRMTPCGKKVTLW
jgi:hypothetical protein